MKFSLLIFPAHQTWVIYFLEKSQFPFFSISKHDLNITTNIIVRPQFQVFEKHHRHSCLSEECHDGKNLNKKKKKKNLTRKKLILWLSSQFTFQISFSNISLNISNVWLCHNSTRGIMHLIKFILHDKEYNKIRCWELECWTISLLVQRVRAREISWRELECWTISLLAQREREGGVRTAKQLPVDSTWCSSRHSWPSPSVQMNKKIHKCNYF